MPIIAIQLKAIKVDGKLSVIFTKVLDELNRGLVGEDEDVQSPATRAHWESRSSPASMAMVDKVLTVVRQFEAKLDLRDTNTYITFTKDNVLHNFAWLFPQKRSLGVKISTSDAENVADRIKAAELDGKFNAKSQTYMFWLTEEALQQSAGLVREILEWQHNGKNT